MSRQIRVGWPAAVLALFVALHGALACTLAAVTPRVLQHIVTHIPWPIGGKLLPEPFTVAALGLAVTLPALLVFAVSTLVRVRHLQPGTEGRGRWTALAVASLLHLLSATPTLVLGWLALRSVAASGLGVLRPSELLLALPNGTELPFAICAATAIATLVAMLGTEATCWFLVPERVRKTLFGVLDALLLGALVLVTVMFPMQPPAAHPHEVAGPALRIAVTALFAVRLLLRLLGPLLRLVERAGFEPLVAARHLQTRKSSFLAAIGTLSILAVAFSSCSLTTTLSVMGGFRQDLKNKILGNHAHIVIDKRHGTFEGWGPVLAKVRSVRGVKGAAPYLKGDVMGSSASNLAGAELRGIDPTEVGNVLDLQKNIVCPKSGKRGLAYLEHPERLLHLPPEDKRCGELPLDIPATAFDVSSPSGGKGKGKAKAKDEAKNDKDATAAAPPPGEKPPKATGTTKPATAPDEGASTPQPDHELLGPAPGQVPPAAGHHGSAGLARELGSLGQPSGQHDETGTDSTADLPDLPPLPDQDDEVLPGIIVGQELARTLRLYLGDEVNVVSPFGELGPTGPMPKSRPFRVAGVFYSGMYEYDMKYAYVTLPVAQQFLNVGDSISGIEVTVHDVDKAPAVAKRIREAIGRPDLRVRDWEQLNKNLFGALALEKLAMFITLGIAILVAGFCVFGTLTLMVQEKGREVGILKAMGTSSRGVVAVFLIEGMLIGVFGAALGLGMGFLVGFVNKHFPVIPINPEVYYIDKLPVHMDPLDFTVVGVAAVLVCLVATVFPAMLASRMKPVEALRYD